MYLRALLITTVLAGLTGCQEVLFAKLTEREANEVVAALGEVKIVASKKNVKDDTWSVLIEPADFGASVRVLNAAGIPNNVFSGLQETFKKQGLASSPMEERARLMSAQSQELERSIRVVDCVVTARVHVNIPAPDRFSAAGQESTVSMLIKHRPNCAVESLPNQLKSLAVNAVENTRGELVSVLLTPALDFTPKEKVAERAGAFDFFSAAPWLVAIIVTGLLCLNLKRVASKLKTLKIKPTKRKANVPAAEVPSE